MANDDVRGEGGVCMTKGGIHGKGGACVAGGMYGRGACVARRRPVCRRDGH